MIAMSPAFEAPHEVLGATVDAGRAVRPRRDASRAGGAASSRRLGALGCSCFAGAGEQLLGVAPRVCDDSPTPASMRDSSPTRASSRSKLGARRPCGRSTSPFATATCASANAATCGRWVTHSTWCCLPTCASARPTAVPASPPMPASTSSNTRVGGAAESTTRRASIARASSPPEAALGQRPGRLARVGREQEGDVVGAVLARGLGCAGLDRDLEASRPASRARAGCASTAAASGPAAACRAADSASAAVGDGAAPARRAPPRASAARASCPSSSARRTRDSSRVRRDVGERRPVLAHELAEARRGAAARRRAVAGRRRSCSAARRGARARPRPLRSAARGGDRRARANGARAASAAIAAPSASCAAPSSARTRVLERVAVRLRVGEELLLGRERASSSGSSIRRRRSRRAGSAAGRSAAHATRSSPPSAASSSSMRAARRTRGRERGACVAAGSPANRSSSARCSAGISSDWCACWPCRSTRRGRARRARPRSRAGRRRSRACARSRERPRASTDLVVAVDEAAFDARFVGAVADERRVGPAAAQQIERVDDQRLARAGLAGDHGHARAERQAAGRR